MLSLMYNCPVQSAKRYNLSLRKRDMFPLFSEETWIFPEVTVLVQPRLPQMH